MAAKTAPAPIGIFTMSNSGTLRGPNHKEEDYVLVDGAACKGRRSDFLRYLSAAFARASWRAATLKSLDAEPSLLPYSVRV
jgi:hypothetical protein